MEKLPEHEMELAADGQMISRNTESDAADDKNERRLAADKAETGDAAVGVELGDTVDEEGQENEILRANRSVQGSQNKNDPIEIDDSYSPSGNNNMDERNGHAEAESVGSQSSKEGAVVEMLDDDEKTGADRQFDDNKDRCETERYEIEVAPVGVDNTEIVDDGANVQDKEYDDSRAARSRKEEAITVDNEDEKHCDVVSGKVDEVKVDQSGEVICESKQGREAQKYNMIERAGTVSTITQLDDTGPLCSEDKFPAAKSASSGNYMGNLPEHEMESASDGKNISPSMESGATGDDNDRRLAVEKAETDDGAVGVGEGGQENEIVRANRSVQGGQKDDPIEIDDSDSPSNNNNMDERDGHAEIESVGSQSSNEDAVVEMVDDDDEAEASRHFVDDEMERRKFEDASEGDDDVEMEDDHENYQDKEFSASRAARSSQEGSITVDTDVKELCDGVHGKVDENKVDQRGEAISEFKQDHNANIYGRADAISATTLDSGPFASDDKSPAEQSIRQELPEHEEDSAADDDKFPAEQSTNPGEYLEKLPEHEKDSAADGQKLSRNRESDATDDEDERRLAVEKAETDDAAVGGEFGDTTDEDEENENVRANRSAEAIRLADWLQDTYEFCTSKRTMLAWTCLSFQPITTRPLFSHMMDMGVMLDCQSRNLKPLRMMQVPG